MSVTTDYAIEAEGLEHHVSEETLAAFRHAMAGNKRR